MARMTQLELKSIIHSELADAYGAGDGQLARDIATGIDYYLGEPFGNEEEATSKVVSHDVQDVVEWILPSLIKIFMSTNRAVEFEPTDPADEATAAQETDIVNHVFMKENSGFLFMYTFFKDALLSKNGIAKIWWDETNTTTTESYTALTEDELIALTDEDGVEVIEATEKDAGTDVKIKRTIPGRAMVEAIPPEEFVISKDANSPDPQSARFSAHKTRKTRSQLKEMGVSQRIINKLSTGFSESGEIKLARNHLDDDEGQKVIAAADKTMQTVEVDECYLSVDFNGDGIAELRQVTLAGNELLLNEEITEIPFVAITPVILTHKFYGLSMADLVKDLQLIKSTILRGVLDSTYLANIPRTAYQKDMVDVDALATARSGGTIECEGPPSNVLLQMQHSPIPPQTFEVLNKMDAARKERTGVSEDQMGLDANTLAHARTGAVQASMEASRMRIELIANIFGELGMKGVFKQLHRVLQQNQDKAKWIRLRGEWIQILPTEWRERTNMTVNVGLGTGNRDREIALLTEILGAQKELLPTGRGVTEGNVYNTLRKLVNLAGVGEPEEFFTDPATQPPPEPQPDPNMEIVKLQQQVEQAKAETGQYKADTDRMRLQFDREQAADADELARVKLELENNQNSPGGLQSV